MKKLNELLSEKLIIKSTSNMFIYHPKTREELLTLIQDRIKNEGVDCELNDIDTTNITNMRRLFVNTNFCGDISQWDVSNVQDAREMFMFCDKFNCDISKWDFKHLLYINGMFEGCKSFYQDLSSWKLPLVTDYNVDKVFTYSKIKRNKEYLPSK